MVIYLRHEKHGTKVAISDLEAKQDEKNGWKRYDVTSQSAISDEQRVRRKYTRRG